MRNTFYRKLKAMCLPAAVLLSGLLFFTGCKNKQSEETKAPETVTETAEETVETEETDETEPALSKAGQEMRQFALPEEGELCAEIVIENYGSIFVKLFERECGRTVENFTTLAKQGYYDNMKVDRILNGYLFQTGNPNADGGESIYGGGFKNEISDSLFPYRGALCMANMGEDGTNTSQFFFVQTTAETLSSIENPLDSRYRMDAIEYFEEAYGVTLSETQWELYKVYGGAPEVQGFNTVFGQTYDGFEVIDAVCEAKVTSKLKPNPSIVISTIRIFRFGEEE